jgi:catalase
VVQALIFPTILVGGRIHSRMWTQISRLGGPNFTSPINAAGAGAQQPRDGMHRQAIPQGPCVHETIAGVVAPSGRCGTGFVTVPAQLKTVYT